MKRLAVLFAGMVLGLMLVVPVQAADKQLDLVKRLETITRTLIGKIGFAAQVLGEKEIISLNGDDPFPMASAYKVAMAAKALKRIQDGELSLNQMVEVPPQRYVFSDIIATNFIHPGLSLSIANLMEVMITHSDNTATDMVLELAGGPVQVTRWLKDNGIEGIRVDRPTEGLMRDFYGLESGLANIGQAIALNRDKPDVVDAPKPAFEADALDKATPKAMLRFLVMLAEGDLLDKPHTDYLLDVMSRTVTGSGRIKGLLPQGTPVAHKTGSIGGVANDVGYITLPDKRRLAIVVFTKSSQTLPPQRDRAIAEVSRTLFDYYAPGGR